jgi:hypothetical protein
VRVVFFLLFLATATAAQEASHVSDARDLTVECSKFGLAPGCKSYNEMVTSNDKDILQLLEEHTFVCFRQSEDVFILITIKEPLDRLFRMTDAQANNSEQPGWLQYSRFKDGVSEKASVTFGKWAKWVFSGETIISFASKGPPSSSADSSEILFTESYENLSRTKTTYNFTLRRSTRRFTENYQWEEPPPKQGTRVKEQTSTQPDLGQNSNSGYCAEFK